MLLLDGQKTVYVVLNAVPIIYINDSVDSAVMEGNCITLYADDMLLYKIINNPQDFICVQQGINNVGRWVTGSNLRLNSAKCDCNKA